MCRDFSLAVRSARECVSGGSSDLVVLCFGCFTSGARCRKCAYRIVRQGGPSTPRKGNRGMLFSSMKAVGSMLFELETLEEADSDVASFSPAVQEVANLVQEATASVNHVSDVLAQLTQQDDLVAAAQALGYSVRLRDCVGGGQGAACLQNLRHSFLILSPSAHAPNARHGACYPSEEIVIDPTFKDNFVIAHPSPRYSAVLEAVPVVFVGSLSRVQPLVAALCSEMALAFKEAGSVMPPWRTTRSMMTKWMPRKSLDLPLGAAGGGPASTHHAAAINPAGGPAAAACHASTGAAAGPAGGRAVHDSTRLLRQACHAAEAAEHSPLAPSSAASCMRSASSSNCSSTSATPVVSVGCDSAAASPTAACGPIRPDLLPAAEAPTATQQAAAHHSSGHAVNVPAAKTSVLRPSSAAQQVVKCFEPLTRVVGGFGFCSTPL